MPDDTQGNAGEAPAVTGGEGGTATTTPPAATNTSVSGDLGQGQGSGVSHVPHTELKTPAQAFEGFVPEAYKSEEWVQNNLKAENPGEAFFKQFKEAQSMVGRQVATVPGEDATQEDWNNYYQSLNAPQDLEQYKPAPMQWTQEQSELGAAVSDQVDPAIIHNLASHAQKLGIHPKQFEGLVHGFQQEYLGLYQDNVQAYSQKSQELDQQYTKYMEGIFGAEASQKQEYGRKVLEQSLDPVAKTILTELSDTKEGTAMLAVLSDFAYNVHTKYAAEDGVTLQTGNVNASGLDPSKSEIDAISDKCIELMNYEKYGDHRDPEGMRRLKEVERLYARQKDLMTNPNAR